jgi:hypothetical protein
MLTLSQHKKVADDNDKRENQQAEDIGAYAPVVLNCLVFHSPPRLPADDYLIDFFQQKYGLGHPMAYKVLVLMSLAIRCYSCGLAEHVVVPQERAPLCGDGQGRHMPAVPAVYGLLWCPGPHTRRAHSAGVHSMVHSLSRALTHSLTQSCTLASAEFRRTRRTARRGRTDWD